MLSTLYTPLSVLYLSLLPSLQYLLRRPLPNKSVAFSFLLLLPPIQLSSSVNRLSPFCIAFLLIVTTVKCFMKKWILFS